MISDNELYEWVASQYEATEKESDRLAAILELIEKKSEAEEFRTPKEPRAKDSSDTSLFGEAFCPVCGNLVFGTEKFCSECGQALKWEGDE